MSQNEIIVGRHQPHRHIWMHAMDLVYFGKYLFGITAVGCILTFLMLGEDWVFTIGIGLVSASLVCLSSYLFWFLGKNSEEITLTKLKEFAEINYEGVPEIRDQDLAFVAAGLGSVAFVYLPRKGINKGKYDVYDRSVVQHSIMSQTESKISEPKVEVYSQVIAEEKKEKASDGIIIIKHFGLWRRFSGAPGELTLKLASIITFRLVPARWLLPGFVSFDRYRDGARDANLPETAAVFFHPTQADVFIKLQAFMRDRQLFES